MLTVPDAVYHHAFLEDIRGIDARYEEMRAANRGADGHLSRFLDLGYTLVRNAFAPAVLAEMADAFPASESMSADLQSSALRFVPDALGKSPWSAMLNHPALQEIIDTVLADEASLVSSWAQLRLPLGPRGDFDELFHFDSYKDRIKAFLYLSDTAPDDGSLTIIPASNRGEWRFPIAYELFEVELAERGKWSTEEEAYETIADSAANLFAGCITPFHARRVMEEQGLDMVNIAPAFGDLLIWDSRCLHKVTPCTMGPRRILDGIWAKGNCFG